MYVGSVCGAKNRKPASSALETGNYVANTENMLFMEIEAKLLAPVELIYPRKSTSAFWNLVGRNL